MATALSQEGHSCVTFQLHVILTALVMPATLSPGSFQVLGSSAQSFPTVAVEYEHLALWLESNFCCMGVIAMMNESTNTEKHPLCSYLARIK